MAPIWPLSWVLEELFGMYNVRPSTADSPKNDISHGLKEVPFSLDMLLQGPWKPMFLVVAIVFAILLYCNVRMTSRTWLSFLHIRSFANQHSPGPPPESKRQSWPSEKATCRHIEPTNQVGIPRVPDFCSGEAVSNGIRTRDLVSSKERFLKNSPYTDKQHLTDLWNIRFEDALLALALECFKPVSKDYAVSDYRTVFNWGEIFSKLQSRVGEHAPYFQQRSYHIVAFRSKLKDMDSYPDLGKLDKDAHIEATAGGILKYWWGTPDSHRRNLATCIWPSREKATAASRCPNHMKAIRVGAPLYAMYSIEIYELNISAGCKSYEIKYIGEHGATAGSSRRH